MTNEYRVHINELFGRRPVITLDKQPSHVYTNNIRHVKSLNFDGQLPTIMIAATLVRLSSNPMGRTFLRLDTNSIELLCKLRKVIEKSVCVSISKGFRINEDTGTFFVNMHGIDKYILTSAKDENDRDVPIDEWENIYNLGCIVGVKIIGLRYDTEKSNPSLVSELIDIIIDFSDNRNHDNTYSYRKTMHISTLSDCVNIQKNLQNELNTLSNRIVVVTEILQYRSKGEDNCKMNLVDITDQIRELKLSDVIDLNNKISIPGYVYLVTPDKYKGTGVLKVGMTEQDHMKLKSRYGNNCKFHLILPSKCPRDTETVLLRLFSEKYEQPFKREYFIGDMESMIYDIIHVVGCFKC